MYYISYYNIFLSKVTEKNDYKDTIIFLVSQNFKFSRNNSRALIKSFQSTLPYFPAPTHLIFSYCPLP